MLTLYALSAPVQMARPASEVSRDVLLAAIAPLTLGQAELSVTYARSEEAGARRDESKQAGQKKK